jgi:hypothetical protein
MFGGEPNEITLHVGEGHSGRGMYASYTDMPEEGTIFLGNSDQEAMPDTPPAATPAAPGEVTLNKKDLNKLLDDFARACAFGDDLLARMAASKAIHEYLDAALAALSSPAPVAAPAMHQATADLVRRFSDALAAKLAAAEKKYGYSDGWLSPDWMDECRAKLLEHIDKGDPRDVAAYCAFLWHHGESTTAPAPASEAVALLGVFSKPMEAESHYIDRLHKNGYPGNRQRSLAFEYGFRSAWKLAGFTAAKHLTSNGTAPATPTPGDSVDAPVQQAGDTGGMTIVKAIRQGLRAEPWKSNGPGKPACVGICAIQIEGWVHTDESAKAFADAYNLGLDHMRAALKGEQPVEPSGSERGDVS